MHADRHTSRRVYTIFWTLTRILSYIDDNPVEKLRGYPILFELNQEKIIRVVEETEWGTPMKVMPNEV